MAKIADLKPGDIMDMVVFVTFCEHRQNNGNSWIKLLVKDITGEIAVMLFDFDDDACKSIIADLQDNKWLHVVGKVESFKGLVNVKAEDIQFVNPPDNISDYFIACPRNFQDLVNELEQLINSIQDENCKLAVEKTIGTNGILREQFLVWPAAKSKHHAYKHGLLEHTVEVTRFAVSDLTNYSSINKDVLLTSALFHDLGKISEYEVDDSKEIKISNSGNLLPHLPLSGMIAYNAFRSVNPTELETEILHCILTHHGRIEWGNSFEFKTKEAELLYLADHKSCVLNRV